MPVYLIHFDTPLAHARHYIGYASSKANLTRRLKHHANGNGARLMQVITEKKITWQLARTWNDGDRTFERRLKNYKKPSRFCPLCAGEKARNCMKG